MCVLLLVGPRRSEIEMKYHEIEGWVRSQILYY